MATIIVTGAGSGIGHALTKRLLQDGHRVAGLDIKPGALAGFTDQKLRFHEVDVRNAKALQTIAQETLADSGTIDGLVTCAAVFPAKPFLELDEDTWDLTLDVNLKGSLLSVQAVLPAMRQQQRGSIVMFSSMIARSGSVRGAHYAATKGGILGLARSLALEVATDGIRANVISPGVTDTPQPRANSTEAELFSRAKDIPMGRIGEAEDMAEAAVFLLGDDSSFVTGQDIRIAGGARLF